MLQPEQRVLQIWKALAEKCEKRTGWSSFPFSTEGESYLRVGMNFPSGREAIFIALRPEILPKKVVFPIANGFALTWLDVQAELPGLWLCLYRQPGSDRKMFTKMAADILTELSKNGDDGSTRFRILMKRISEWQRFMERHRSVRLLSLEEKIGLCGELEILNDLINAGISAEDAVLAWTGPLGKLHDFTFPSWAIEVKATVSHPNFLIQIGSGDQLDPALISPLYLTACLYVVDEEGEDLGSRLTTLISRLQSFPDALELFKRRLGCLGIEDLQSLETDEKFVLVRKKIFHISETFPALVTSLLPSSIQNIKYTIDISQLNEETFTIIDIVKNLGVVLYGTK